MSNDFKPMKILFFPSDEFGCGHYRMIDPAKELSRRGHNCTISSHFSAALDDSFDLYHFQRVTNPAGLAAVMSVIKRGQPCMMDMDDDLFNLYPGHPSAWYFRKAYECLSCGNTRIYEEGKCWKCGSTNLQFQDRLKCTQTALHEVDLMSFSTPELADRYKNGAKDYVVIPNYITGNQFAGLPKKNDDYIAVGWAGSFTHTLDILEIGQSLRAINEFPNAYLFAVGVEPEILFKNFAPAMEKGKLVVLDSVEFERYPELLTNFDIGLAPVVDNLFNRCKSELKAMEYGAVGLPVIASAVAPYTRYIEHGKDGFLVKKSKDWYRYTKQLLEDSELRKKMGEAAQDKAARNTIEVNVAQREQVYRDLIERKGYTKKKVSPFGI
jgi:glycosyltransferase involved in cell wall biosynthesis